MTIALHIQIYEDKNKSKNKKYKKQEVNEIHQTGIIYCGKLPSIRHQHITQ